MSLEKIHIDKFDAMGSLNEMRDLYFPILFVPFCGSFVPVMVKELNHAETLSCGNFSLIETLEDKMRMKSKDIKIRDVIAYAERNHNIVNESLVKPTYNQVMKILNDLPKIEENRKEINELKIKKERFKTIKRFFGIINKIDTKINILDEDIKKIHEKDYNNDRNNKKNKMDELTKELHKLKPGPARSALQEKIDNLRIKVDLILPDDFTSWIVCYALGINKSDIKKVSSKMLLDAAILAKNNNNSPADNLKGRFTDFMIDDINRRAWIEYNKFMEEHNQKKKGK